MTTTVTAPTATGGAVAAVLDRYRSLLKQEAQAVTTAPDPLVRAAAAMRAAARGAGEVGEDVADARPGDGWTGKASEAFVAGSARQSKRLAAAAKAGTASADALDQLVAVLRMAPIQLAVVRASFEMGATIILSLARPNVADVSALVSAAEGLGTEAAKAAAQVRDELDAALRTFIQKVTAAKQMLDPPPARKTDGKAGGSKEKAKDESKDKDEPKDKDRDEPKEKAKDESKEEQRDDPPADAKPAPDAPRSGSVSGVPYADLFNQAGEKHGVPPALLAAVARVESDYNPRAVSPVGARGLMQFMPETASSLGINPLDPAQAVDGAARLLKENLERFGSVDLALAAYNAGPTAVDEHGGIPPYRETQEYVPKVKAAMAALGGRP